MAEKVTLAIVGCGGIAGAHREGLRKLWEAGIRDFEVIATVDIERSRAEKMADQVAEFQGKRPTPYQLLEEMLQTERALDAVDICSLHRNHHTLAIPCFEAGKHVTIEKPLALTLKAGRLMLAAAQKAGTVFQVAENYRRAPEHRAIHWAVRQGDIGEIRMIFWLDVGERLWYWTWREHRMDAGGGWVLDGGVHFADLFRYHVGEVETVAARAHAFHPYRYGKPDTLEDPIPVDVEDTVMATLTFQNGAMGQWTSVSAAPGKGFNQRVLYGEHGSIDFSSGLRTRSGHEESLEQMVERFRKAIGEDGWEQMFPRGVTDTIATELWEFIQAVQGKTSVEIDGVEGYKDEAICMAVYESSWLNGSTVAVADVEAGAIANYQRDLDEAIGL